MASEASATAQSAPQYQEDWLPEDFKPLTFRQLCWSKLKSAPLVGVATVYSLVMASYYFRLGNSKMFNVWLRWRVGSQAATIAALVYYGGIALTEEKQFEYMQKQRVLLGELPADYPIQKVSNAPAWWPWKGENSKSATEDAIYRAAVMQSQQTASADPHSAEDTSIPLSERIKAAEFAARLRAAERAHEDEQRIRREAGIQAQTSAGRAFKERLEQAAAEPGSSAAAERVWKVSNKNKLKKMAAAEEEEKRKADGAGVPAGESVLQDKADGM